MLARQQSPSRARRLGDYPEILPHRVMLTQSAEERGPVTGPTIGGEQPDINIQIRDLLARMPKMMSDEWRSRFVMTPREAVSFAEPGGPVAVGVGLAVAVVSVTIEEMFTGFLQWVGVNVDPAGSFASITWQIRINGATHPKFDSNIYNANTLATPLPFSLELPQTSIVQLVAINGAGVPITCSGVLCGWVEYMASFKDYGWSPSSGIG
jgi:hypothetical protein